MIPLHVTREELTRVLADRRGRSRQISFGYPWKVILSITKPEIPIGISIKNDRNEEVFITGTAIEKLYSKWILAKDNHPDAQLEGDNLG